MTRLPRSFWRGAGILALVLAVASPARAQSNWTAVNLGALGGVGGWADDINDAGHVVGFADGGNDEDHAFLWTPAGGMVDLGVLEGQTSYASAINNLGQIVGTSDAGVCAPPCFRPIQRAFLWTAAGGMVDLGTLGGSNSSAGDINDAGQVVGSSEIEIGCGFSCATRAFLWTAAGGMLDLGTLGGDFSGANAINEHGEVVGTSTTASGETRAFLWTAAGGMVDLGTLGGESSLASAINNLGQVVGTSQTAAGDTQGFLWTSAAGMIMPFGTLGGDDTLAYDINDAGQVVGRSLLANGNRHPFIWTEAGGIVDLGTLGGLVGFAYGINEGGQVVGRSEVVDDGPQVATLWIEETDAPTAEEQVESLIAAIGGLVADGSLPAGYDMTVPLRGALQTLANGNVGPACSQLRAFSAHAAELVRIGIITAEEGSALIDAAADIRSALGCVAPG